MPKELLEANAKWAEKIKSEDASFFERLSKQQSPEYLWIGCSDSRVPANQIIGLMPGEIFVHRNIANQVIHTDVNCLSVIQYAVEALKVKQIIVCGHYGCGGVAAALDNKALGLIDNWLRHLKDNYHRNHAEIDAIADNQQKIDRMCELNVIQQVANLCHTAIIQGAWARGQELKVHGWIYGLSDGLIKDLDVSLQSSDQLPEAYRLDLG